MPPTASPDSPKCSTCPVDDCSGKNTADDMPLMGGRFVLASLGLFLGPLVLALLGAVCGGGTPVGQLCGALLGLGLGMVGSVGIAGILRRVSKDI